MSATVFSMRGSAVVGAAINALLNGALGFALAPAGGLPLWGLASVGTDLLAMAFGIAFGTALVVTPQLRALGRRGDAVPPPLSPFWREGFSRWPRGVLHRSVNLGVLGVLLFVPLPLLALAVLAPEGLSAPGFVAFKAAFAGVEGALVTPLIAVAALSDTARPHVAH